MDTLPETFSATLAHYGLISTLTSYIPRKDITSRVSWSEFTRFIESQGYKNVTEGGNVYGRVGVRKDYGNKFPPMRMVTRSDVAAVYGGKR